MTVTQLTATLASKSTSFSAIEAMSVPKTTKTLEVTKWPDRSCQSALSLEYVKEAPGKDLVIASIFFHRLESVCRALLDMIGLHSKVKQARNEVHFFDVEENYEVY